MGICYARLSVHIYHLVIIFLSSILSLLFPLAFIPSKQAHSPHINSEETEQSLLYVRLLLQLLLTVLFIIT